MKRPPAPTLSPPKPKLDARAVAAPDLRDIKGQESAKRALEVAAGADALVLLSDIETLFTRPPSEPGARPITDVEWGHDLSEFEFGAGVVNGVGTGGVVPRSTVAPRNISMSPNLVTGAVN